MTVNSPRRSQDQRTRSTTAALLRAAETQFGKRGYDAASLDDIATRAGVTKGALYHHFPGGKDALFEAVVLRLQARLVLALDEAAKEAAGLPGLKHVLDTYFSVAAQPEFHRITLLDAPAVFGPEKWREIEFAHALKHIRHSVELVLAASRATEAEKVMLARTFFGAMNEATFAVVSAPDRAAARRLAVDVITSIVEGTYTVLLRPEPKRQNA